MRPRYEGANIRTWIGFKHLMYLAEDALLTWFRDQGFGPQRLLHEYGAGLELIDMSAQLPSLVEIDDQILGEVRVTGPGTFAVQLRACRDGTSPTVLNGKARFVLVPDPLGADRSSLPLHLAPLRLDDASRDSDDLAMATDPESTLRAAHPEAFYWAWQARYFHCHCSGRVQHSAYLRALEEVVDRFLAARGLPIGRMLSERGLIPVVSRANVQSGAPAFMDETVHTIFRIDDILKSTAYDGRMDCYVQRQETLTHVAGGRILHGYAISRGPDAGRLAPLDAAIVDALVGRSSS
jgi:acyl-CoA thioesterase FadM